MLSSLARLASLSRNWVALGYLAYGVDVVAAVAISMLVVRALSIEEFAAYKLAGSILLVGAALTSLGLDATLQRYGAELLARRDSGRILRLLRATLRARSVALLLFCALLISFRGAVAEFLRFPQQLTDTLLLVCGILVAQSTLSINGYTLLNTRGEASLAASVKISVALIRMVGIGIAFLAAAGLVGILTAIMLSAVLPLTYVWWRNRTWMQTLYRQPRDSASLEGGEYRKRILKYGLVSLVAINVTSFRDLAIDQFVISHFLTPRDVAIYGLAATLITFATTINPASLLRGVITPMVVSMSVSGDRAEKLPQAYQLLTKAVLVVYLPIAAYLLVVGREVIIHAYSPDYLEAFPSVVVLTVLGFFSAITYPFGPLIAALERNRLLLLTAVTAIYNVVLDIVLVPRFGVIGAAWATGTAGLLQFAIIAYAFKASCGDVRLKFPHAALVSTLVNLVPAIAWLMLARQWVEGLWSLLLVSCVYLSTYIGASLLRNVFSRREMALMRSASVK